MTGENARGTRRGVSEGVATISLERPDRRNAVTRDMVQQLCAEFDAIGSDDDIRTIIVTGTGRSFCVGRISAIRMPSVGVRNTPRDPGVT